MDLSRSVTYRGLDINALATLSPGDPLDGYVLNECRMPPVDGVGYREKRSLGDGFDFGRVYLGRRQFMLRGTIYAPSEAVLHDRIRIIRALFTPTLAYAQDPANYGFLPIAFTLPTADTANFPSGLLPLRAFVRPEEMPGAMFDRDMAFGDDVRGYSMPYEAMLEARDPRFYAQTSTEVAVTATSGSGSTTNKGDYPAPLQMSVILSGATSGPRTITLTGFGSVMTVTVPSGGTTRTVRIDGVLKIATLTQNGVETLRMDLVSFAAGYTWPKVVPGPNAYDWTSTGGGKSTGSKFWYDEAFV